MGTEFSLENARAFLSRLRETLAPSDEVKREFFIHAALLSALRWNLDKTESLDLELLTLGPKGGQSNPKSILPGFEFRLLIYTVLALLCMVPRLYIGVKAVIAHGGDSFSGLAGWQYGLIWGLIFYYPTMLFPLWGQWICFTYAYLQKAPAPISLASNEALAICVLGAVLAMPPALVFVTWSFATVIHSMRRNWAGDRRYSGVFQHEQNSLFWFLRLYVLLLIPAQHAPRFTAAFAFWSLWICLSLSLIAYLATAFQWSSGPRSESSNPQPTQGGEFQYTRLASQSHFRLLRVSPSLSSNAPVQCSLIQIPLDGSGMGQPRYSAISYHWHPEQSATSESITINGFHKAIPSNVLTILKDVRSFILPQYIWIDSICINQGDLREKEGQVAVMRQIYQRSQGVIIHLAGLDIPQSERIRVSVMIEKLRSTRVLEEFSASDSPGDLIPLGSNGDWDVLVSLLDDPWFSRVWIVQEVAVAKRVRLRLPGQELNWGSFVRACAVLSRSGVRGNIYHRYLVEPQSGLPRPSKDSTMAGVEHTLILDNLRQWYASGRQLPLLDTMILCLRFKSTWDVDKLYGLLGIIDANDRMELGLEPDYTRDPTSMFQELACRLLDHAKPEDQFRVLRFAGIGQSRNIDDLPSWVPDWTAGLPACSFETRNPATDYAASKRQAKPLRMQYSPSDYPYRGLPDLLVVSGIIVDRVVLLCDVSHTPCPEDETSLPFSDALAAVKTHASSGDMYRSTSEPIEEAFWRTMIANRETVSTNYRPASIDVVKMWALQHRVYEVARSGKGKREIMEEFAPDQEVKHDDDTWDLRRTILAMWFWQADDEDLRFSHMLAADLAKRWPEHQHAVGAARILNRPFDTKQATEPRMSAGRQFCITGKGYFGLVPRLTEVGDVVAVFDGAKTPHIVRPSGDWNFGSAAENGLRCRLVGDCFIHHGMDGQLENEIGRGDRRHTFLLH